MTDDDPLPDNALFDLYERYIGEPDSRVDVYLGFGLFFGGIALAGVGLVLFLAAFGFERGSDTYWLFREGSFGMGMMSVPTLLLGILVLLPVASRAVYAGAIGTAITFGAVIGFAILYPYNFNVEGAQYTVHVVLGYGVGMAFVLAATGSALVAHQIERNKPGPADIEPIEESEPEPEETFSDEEIREDIEQAMEDVDITWGGVEKHEGTSLQLEMGEDMDTSGMDVDLDATTITRSSSTDTQVQGLKALKGGEKQTDTSESTVDDQTAALTELRQRRREEEQETHQATTGGDETFSNKIKSFIGLK